MGTQITCPSGHKVAVEELHSYVKLDVEELDEAIVFDCPGGKRGHTFTLRKAVSAGMFDIEQAARIREAGRQHRETAKAEA